MSSILFAFNKKYWDVKPPKYEYKYIFIHGYIWISNAFSISKMHITIHYIFQQYFLSIFRALQKNSCTVKNVIILILIVLNAGKIVGKAGIPWENLNHREGQTDGTPADKHDFTFAIKDVRFILNFQYKGSLKRAIELTRCLEDYC